jgi:excisionase family DNA binding protein
MSSAADIASKDTSQKADSVGNRGGDPGHLQRLAYSVAEAAAVSNLSRSKLYELLASGELRSIKIAGRRLIRRSDLLCLLQMEAE